MSEEVIELSIDETNRLRAELGLAPLRLDANQTPQQALPPAGTSTATAAAAARDGEEEVLELSVDDTNSLRAKLGLPPLRSTSTKKPDIHKPAENDRDTKEAAERIAEAKLKREVEVGAAQTFGSSTLADDAENTALSWAEQMRRKKQVSSTSAKDFKSRKKTTNQTLTNRNYDERDLEGIQVAHSMNELEAGATTVLTLADAPLLSQSLDETTSKKIVGLNEGDIALENVNLAESKKQQDGLRKKRLLEMGMGRAGGYAGFDDEEFEELGGTLGPSKQQRGNALLDASMDEEDGGKPLGFRIGGSNDPNGDSSTTDFDKIQMGKAVSLVPDKADLAASDYMTAEEEQAERALRKTKKDGKFKKKKKKKDKKRRKTAIDSDEEEEDEEGASNMKISSNTNGTVVKSNLLNQLEETAVPASSGLRKRRRTDDDDKEDVPVAKKEFVSVKQESGEAPAANKQDKRSKYDDIMAKGNERTKQAFAEKVKSKRSEEHLLDDEPDDSFLNAALAKARRLNRLRDMNNKPTSKGADAVAESVKSMSAHSTQAASKEATSGGVTFAIDDTREFTLALQAKTQQKEREDEKAKQQRATTAKANQIVKKEDNGAAETKMEEVTVETTNEDEDVDIDMEELAKEVQADEVDDNGFGASTARSAGVGRGLSSFVSMLKTTGEISSKNVKEELRGRAKDERNYENYAPLDLAKVVKLGRNATDKDRELANREIKLEYRDKHGRLLTTKEAYRDLCYQFHGHGASKKKEEKRLKQIEREQAQARMASRQVAAARDGTTAGTFGALRATQKATGKAFIVHKT